MESTVDNDIPTSVNDVETHIDKLSKFFYTDKCEDYLRDIIEVEEKILKGEINFSSKVQGLEDKDEILKYFKSIPVIDQIYDDEHLLHRCVELQKFVQGTKPDSEYKGIKTWFKYEGGKNKNLCLLIFLITIFLCTLYFVLCRCKISHNLWWHFDRMRFVPSLCSFI